MYTYIYVYICICIYTYINIYIYLSLSMYLDTFYDDPLSVFAFCRDRGMGRGDHLHSERHGGHQPGGADLGCGEHRVARLVLGGFFSW